MLRKNNIFKKKGILEDGIRERKPAVWMQLISSATCFKILLFFIFLMTRTNFYGQRIDKADLLPLVGEQFRIQIFNNQPYINLDNSGLTQVWDLSSIKTAKLTEKVYQIVDPSSTPYTIPSASFAYKYFVTDDSSSFGYRYYKDTANGFYQQRDILPYLTKEFSNPEFILKFPIYFNDSIVDHSCYTSITSLFYDYFCGDTKLIFDGTGTLILPSQTYSDVCRLSYSNYYLRESLSDTIRTKSWLWFKKGIHFPVAEYIIFTMDGADYRTVNILNPKFTNTILPATNSDRITIYHNTANGTLSIRSSELNLSGFEITVYDVEGKIVRKEEIRESTKEFFIDMNGCEKGLYAYCLTNRSGIFSNGKIILD